MFKKVDTKLDFIDDELKVQNFWQDNNIFEKSVSKNDGKHDFVVYDGPPTANGKPHIGHVLARTIKDIIPRYKTMKGYRVERIAGWDTHGLPVELEVEKELGFTNKDDILKYGIEPFIQKCKSSVWKYKSLWEDMSKRVGYWADYEKPYITYEDDYIESVWWSLKELDKKGLLYCGVKILPYCPRCGTSLSSHEVDQNYKLVKDTSAFVKFKVKGQDNKYLLAWTTTPWTLPSNVALCVNPKNDYCEITYKGENFILAKNLVEDLFEEYETVKVFKGKQLEYLEYEQLFATSARLVGKGFYVTCDEYVTLDSGTGIVHIAPAFGEEDANVGKNYNLPFLQLINDKGEFTKDSEFVGLKTKQADKVILEQLQSRGLLFKTLLYEHSYPHCWRCDTPLIYFASKSWFVKMSAVRDELVKNNRSVYWLPENFKEGRMGNFLENAIDWCLTRNRYWGTPLPVWKCQCGHHVTIGSKKELFSLSGKKVKELHKPYIDEVEIKCEKCGKMMHRESEVIDCWYDSGSMPFAQFHYPFENQERFKTHFPADFISEGLDQSRGWFYVLQALGTTLFEKSPYKACIALGLINDKNGIKMSKHLGNVIAPNDILDTEGADAVRWYFCSSSAPWLSVKFSKEVVEESKRKFMGTLWNTYAFFVLYANIDKFNPQKYDINNCQLSMMDKWVLSELNTVIKTVDGLLNEYDLFKASRTINDFVDMLSNWYVRRCRRRFWCSGMEPDKIAAYMTLYTCLINIAKVIAPFVPFISENIYQNLVRTVDKDAPISIHLCDWPKVDESAIDKKLEEKMETVIKSVVLGRAARNSANIKNRQPLANILINSSSKKVVFDEEMVKNIKEELNVDKVTVVDSIDDIVEYNLKPQLRTLGPKYGKHIGAIRDYLASCDGKELVEQINHKGAVIREIANEKVEFTIDDLLITKENKANGESAVDGELTVILDTTLTDDLIYRGYVFDIISRLQNLRKQTGYEVEERINVYITSDDKMIAILQNYIKMIKDDIIAKEVSLTDKTTEHCTEFDVDGHNVKICIER